MAAYIDQFYAHQPLTLIFGAMRDKSIEEIVETLFPRFSEIIITAPNQPRAVSPEALLEIIDHPNVRTTPSLRDALAQVHTTTFVTGSLFLVGEARQSFFPFMP